MSLSWTRRRGASRKKGDDDNKEKREEEEEERGRRKDVCFDVLNYYSLWDSSASIAINMRTY